MTIADRVYLSPPHLGDDELLMVSEAFRSNWIAPMGPHVDGFEREFAAYTGTAHAVALSSGTAALHLALHAVGVSTGDEVWISTLTFAASAFPVCYLGATPVFVDSDRASWNMDPSLFVSALNDAARRQRLPKAIVLVHLYGQCADVDPIVAACRRYGVKVIEDAAEALGARYKGRAAGTLGDVGIFSFNGNKIITTSGGGMLVTDDEAMATRVRTLATQSRLAVAHYEHAEVGYNYRLSNVLAGIGRGQLLSIENRVSARRQVFARYLAGLGDLPGISFMPEAAFGSAQSRANRWLSVITIDPDAFGADTHHVRAALEAINVESRPVWKPMHQQPVFANCRVLGGAVADDLFARGLCLPSGSSLALADQERVIATVRSACSSTRATGAPHGGVMRTPLWTRAVRTAAA